MLSEIPQIFHRTQVADKERLRAQELELICKSCVSCTSSMAGPT
jgi:hypothetical protein